MGLWAKCWMGDWTKHMAPDTWPTPGKWGIPENGFQKCLFQVARALRSWLEEAWGIPVETVIFFIVEIHPWSGAHENEYHSEDISFKSRLLDFVRITRLKKVPAPLNKIKGWYSSPYVVRLWENHKIASVRYWWRFEDVRYWWRCENLRYWWNCGDCVCVEMPPVDFACTRPRSAGGKIGYSFPL